MAGIAESLQPDVLLRAALATFVAAMGLVLMLGIRDRWFRD